MATTTAGTAPGEGSACQKWAAGVVAGPVLASDDGAGAAGQVLRAAGLAATEPRRAVHEVLAGRERPASALDIYDLLRARGRRLGLTSIYRVLQSFAAAGIVHVFPGGEHRFRVCAARPHAHLICEECGRVIEYPADVVRGWLAPSRDDADFVANVEHSDVYGCCGLCRAREPGREPGMASNG